MAFAANVNPNSKYPSIFLETRMFEAGIEVFRFHYDRMIKSEIGTILGEDIEFLHDMRVATRRMRIALDIFGKYYERKSIKRYNKKFRRTGKILGRVRDLDVLISLLNQYREIRSREQMSGVEPLMDALELTRKKEKLKMLEYLTGEKYQEFKGAFQCFLNSPESSKESSLSDVKVRQVYTETINKRLKVFQIMGKIGEKPTVDQLHKARIAFKYLRYTLENFQNPIGDKTQFYIELLKEIQDHLGMINDIKMLLNTIDGLTLEEGQITTIKYTKSSMILARNLQEELYQLIDSVPIFWNKFDRQSFRNCLNVHSEIQ
ncbi:MAG: CHAD domain-containing protein [Candidatus Hodarchaeales archaeon]